MSNGTPQKYTVEQHVNVCGWAGSATGKVKHIQWIYHHRLERYTWGYVIDWDEGQENPFAMEYIPEGYLREILETQPSI